MKKNIENDQDILALVWSIQNNGSNAISAPKRLAEKIIKQKVNCVYDEINDCNIYSLETIDDISKDNKSSESKLNRNKGGRPTVLKEQDKAKINKWKRMEKPLSNREIAKRIKVSEWTIRNYINKKEVNV